MLKKPELVCPAGDLEKLKIAVLYGADAVYAGGMAFSLRARAGNFTEDELREGIDFAHKHGVRVFIAVNIYAHNEHLAMLPAYLHKLAEMGVDAIIVSDPGIVAIAQKEVPQIPLHISTQANCTNASAAVFWQKQGAKRIVLARELSLAEIGEIAACGVETEMFVHGAMCMAYSGRCLISSYMNGRSANLGDCTQPCRWHYRLEEEKRPGEFFGLEEDQWGSYIFNSKDLCLIDYLPQIMRCGVNALKIEGRMKSAFYVANVTRIYREAIDSCFDDIENYKVLPRWHDELNKVSHRPYGSGFAIGDASDLQIYNTTATLRGYDFAGLILGYENGRLLIEQRNNLQIGDELEVITPREGEFNLKISAMWDENGVSLSAMPHPKQIGYIAYGRELPAGSIIRRPVREV